MFFSENFSQCENESLLEFLGISIKLINNSEICSEFAIKEHHIAPNGFLHIGSIITLADASCSHGCIANLPSNAKGFKTIELKSNHLDTTNTGHLCCVATATHLEPNKQVWNAIITHRESGKTIAIFQCVQMVLYDTPNN